MCDFCNGNKSIDSFMTEFLLKIYIDKEFTDLMLVRLEQGVVKMTKPVNIKYCPFCGKSLG